VLDRLRREEEMGVLLELGGDVVGVPVGRNESSLDRLEETVDLPSSL